MENVIENNKLIAEFMGFRPVIGGGANIICNASVTPFANWDFGHGDTPDKLKFHTSWDWLMPVVEKIEETDVNGLQYSYSYSVGRANDGVSSGNRHEVLELMGNGVTFEISSCIRVIFSGYTCITDFYYDSYMGTKIEATYKAVVEFIKWYNENK